MINLFNEIIQTTDGKFMCLSKESPLVTDNLLHNHIKKCLMEGMREKELINLKGLRAGGATFTLINFAKENDLSVIVLYGDVDKLRQEYNYKYIYNINSLNLARGGTKNNIVIDVGVYSKGNIERIKNAGFNIITGYIQDLDIKDEVHKNETNFNKDVINNLKKEIVLLGNSMKNERLKGNYSNYKHLINSYKEIMKLIQDLNNEDNNFGESIRIKTNKKADIIVDKSGIKIEGNMISLGDALEAIQGAWDNILKKEKELISDTLAGKKESSYFEAILNSTRKSGLNIGESLKNISKTLEKEKFYIELYYREGKEPASIGIFNKDKLWIITNIHDVDEIIKFIENDIPCEKDNSIFYVDTNSIYSTLKENGYDVRELECKILNN